MAEFFLELFSEEIPARMQAGAAADLEVKVRTLLVTLQPTNIRTWSGTRRIGLAADIATETSAVDHAIRGPRLGAPKAAIEGFLRKNNDTAENLIEDNGFYMLKRRQSPDQAADVIQILLAGAITNLPWPKSMRWGQSGDYTWVRPLRRVVCLLDGKVVPIRIGYVEADDLSEGHRLLAPGIFKVISAQQWEEELLTRRVVASAGRRRIMIEQGLNKVAVERDLTIVRDDSLISEVTGLVEWPVCLIGNIEPRYMTLPSEVRELSMKVNQRYFSTRDAAGNPAPFFAFVANIETNDGGAAIISGNERVLRARLADAEHFWNLDCKHPLEYYLSKLQHVIFHAKLGTQFERAERIAQLAHEIAESLGGTELEIEQAETAGRLCKADLVTGMVGEFPELQGVMGGYYANDLGVGTAIRSHYQPKGPSDAVPLGIVPCAVALADKIDSLREFFRIGEKPTGSGDPYALRRAALGIIRIILENNLSLPLSFILNYEVMDFVLERLRVKLKNDGIRYDVFNSIISRYLVGDLLVLLNTIKQLELFLETSVGNDVLMTYRRIINVLPVELQDGSPDLEECSVSLFVSDYEREIYSQYVVVTKFIDDSLYSTGDFEASLMSLANLTAPVAAFFDHVKVNVDDPELRSNRLNLLANLRDVMHRVADFSKLEG